MGRRGAGESLEQAALEVELTLVARLAEPAAYVDQDGDGMSFRIQIEIHIVRCGGGLDLEFKDLLHRGRFRRAALCLQPLVAVAHSHEEIVD